MAVDKLSDGIRRFYDDAPQARAMGGQRGRIGVTTWGSGHHSGVTVPGAISLPADSPLRGLAGRPTLVVLLRSFGCTFCREAMADIAAAKLDILDAGANIAFVHGASSIEAAPWFAKYGLDDLMTVSDPNAGALRGVRTRPNRGRRAGRSDRLGARRGLRAVARFWRTDRGHDAATARCLPRAARPYPRRVSSPKPRRSSRLRRARSLRCRDAAVRWKPSAPPLEDSCPFDRSRRR